MGDEGDGEIQRTNTRGTGNRGHIGEGGRMNVRMTEVGIRQTARRISKSVSAAKIAQLRRCDQHYWSCSQSWELLSSLLNNHHRWGKSTQVVLKFYSRHVKSHLSTSFLTPTLTWSDVWPNLTHRYLERNLLTWNSFTTFLINLQFHPLRMCHIKSRPDK